MTKDFLIEKLKKSNGNISETARLLTISRRQLYRKIKKFNIDVSLYIKSVKNRCKNCNIELLNVKFLCIPCKNEKRKLYLRKLRKDRKNKPKNPLVPDHLHGTKLGIEKYKCYCQKCMLKKKSLQNLKRKEIIKNNIPIKSHGTLTGYIYYGCRCLDCKIIKNKKDQGRSHKKSR